MLQKKSYLKTLNFETMIIFPGTVIGCTYKNNRIFGYIEETMEYFQQFMPEDYFRKYLRTHKSKGFPFKMMKNPDRLDACTNFNIFKNESMSGFIIKDIGHKYMTLKDPRGFKVRILNDNMAHLLEHNAVSEKKEISGALIYGWRDGEFYLFSNESIEYKNNLVKVSGLEMTPGNYYFDPDNTRDIAVYIGTYPTVCFKKCKENYREFIVSRIRTKPQSFFSKKGKVFMSNKKMVEIPDWEPLFFDEVDKLKEQIKFKTINSYLNSKFYPKNFVVRPNENMCIEGKSLDFQVKKFYIVNLFKSNKLYIVDRRNEYITPVIEMTCNDSHFCIRRMNWNLERFQETLSGEEFIEVYSFECNRYNGKIDKHLESIFLKDKYNDLISVSETANFNFSNFISQKVF